MGDVANFRADIRRMLRSRNAIGALIASVATDPDAFYSPTTGNYEIRGLRRISQASGVTYRVLERELRGRIRKT